MLRIQTSLGIHKQGNLATNSQKPLERNGDIFSARGDVVECSMHAIQWNL